LRSGGAIWAAVAKATGVQTAAKHAAATLVASSSEKVGARAAAAFAPANRIRQVTRSRLRGTRPVAATRTGERTA